MSMVDRIMEGVVRKNSPTKRMKLMPSHWNHQLEALNGEVLPAERRTQALEAYLSGSGHLRHQQCTWLRVGQKVRFRQGK